MIVGREEEAAHQPEIRVRPVSPDYLATARIPVLNGRGIRASDDADAEPVALVNQAAVRRFFPDGDPIGEQIRFYGVNRRIVGVVGDVKFEGLEQSTPPAVYTPLDQTPRAEAGLLVRTSVDPATLEAPIRRIVHELDPNLALYGMEPMSQALAGTLAEPRFVAVLIGLFAALAVSSPSWAWRASSPTRWRAGDRSSGSGSRWAPGRGASAPWSSATDCAWPAGASRSASGPRWPSRGCSGASCSR